MKIASLVQSVKKSSPIVKAGLVLVAVLAAWGIFKLVVPAGSTRAAGPGGITVAVEISPVRVGPIRDLGLFSGTLIPKTSFTVAPKISGRLKQLLVDIGDMVRHDQLVAVIEDEEYQQQVLQAEADLRIARANLAEARSSLELAKRDLERARTLHARGIQSDAQMDSVVAQYEALESRVKVQEAQEANREAALETARLRLSYTRIRASWDRGSEVRFVGERFVNEGAMLSTNSPLISIIELRPITAVIFVSDKDYQSLMVGQETSVTSSAFPDKSFSGKVVRIAPLLQEQSRSARIEIEIGNPESLLKPGMFITVEVEYARRAETTIVPVNAVVQRENRSGIFLADLENRVARFVPIRTGIVQGEEIEILEPSPLAGNVITLGHHLLEDGTNILLPQLGSPGAGEKKAPDKTGGKPASKPAGQRSTRGQP